MPISAATSSDPEGERKDGAPPGLARDTAVVASATVLSRILGFARDVMLAQALGSGPVADAFFLALRIPNLVRRVLGEGGLNAGLIPIEHRIREDEGAAEARRFAGEALATVALGVIGVTAVLEILAPVVIALLAPGFSGQDEAALATLFLRLSAPLVAAATLAALITALLAARSRFGVAAFAPVAVNGLQVLVLVLLVELAGPDPVAGAILLAATISLGGVLQCLIVLPPLLRLKDRPFLAWPRWSPAFRRLLRLGGPGLLVVASPQLSFLVVLQLASTMPGAVSHLHYADRVAQLPLGFIASALGIVVLPELARRASDQTGFAAAISRACELVALIGLPAALALVLLAEPIAATLFERGAFLRSDTLATADALAAMATGLPFAVAARVLSQAFFARERARPALVATLLGLLATFVAALALQPRFGLAGLALALSVGALIEALALAAPLVILGWWPPDPRLAGRLGRTGLASLVMALGLVWGLSLLSPVFAGGSGLVSCGALAALCISGLIVYGLSAHLFGAFDWRELMRKPPLA
jgi:putative peptidoglycan lipid II flippase